MASETDRLDRKWMGTRVSFVLAAVICYFGTLFVITTYGTSFAHPEAPYEVLHQEQTWEALEWLLMAIGAAILGDTMRPSGTRQAAFGVVAHREKAE